MRGAFWASAACVLVAGCATVRLMPTEVAVTAVAVEQRFGLAGNLRMPTGTPLVLAFVDDKKAYCSSKPVAFNPFEGRGACFFDTAGTGYFDKWYMLGTISSATLDGINIGYSVKQAPASPQRVDVDWNQRTSGEGSNEATETAIKLRDAAGGVPVCAPNIVSDFCDRLRADTATTRLEAAELALIRAKRDAGRKITGQEAALIAQADASTAVTRIAVQTALAQSAAQHVASALERHAAQLAYQQRLAECKAAAGLVAILVPSFWGGVAAGVATGAACMN